MLANPNPQRPPEFSDVIVPWVNGLDVTAPNAVMWIVDFGATTPIEARHVRATIRADGREGTPDTIENPRGHSRQLVAS